MGVFFSSLIALSLLTVGMSAGMHPLLRVVFAVFILCANSALWSSFVAKLLGKRYSRFFLFLLGIGYNIYFFAFLSSAFLVLYKFNVSIFSFVLFLGTLINGILGILSKEAIFLPPRHFWKSLFLKCRSFFLEINPLRVFVFVLCAEIAIVTIAKFQTFKIIFSPWEMLPGFLVYVVGLLTLLIFCFIFFLKDTSSARVFVLCAIILHSFVLHFYIPGVYRFPFGMDQLRHVASEEKILAQGSIPPVLFGGDVSYVRIGPMNVPEVLIAGNKTSYGALWAQNIMAHYITGAPLLAIELWLGFILWSLFIPLFLYFLFGFMARSARYRLLGAFFASLFFSFQMYGAIGLPIGVNFAFFALCVAFCFAFMKYGGKKLLAFCLFLSTLSYFGYIVYAIANVLLFLYAIYFRTALRTNARPAFRRIFLGFFAVFELAFIALLERFGSPMSALRESALYAPTAHAKLFFQEFVLRNFFGAGSVLKRSPALQDSLYFIGQSAQSLTDVFLLRGVFMIKIMLIALSAFSVFGVLLIFAHRRKKTLEGVDQNLFFASAYFLVLFLGNVAVSWYFFSGIHLLVERMDLIISLLLICTLLYGFIYSCGKTSGRRKRYYSIGATIFFTVAMLSAYTSGPRYASRVIPEHLTAMHYVYEDMAERNAFDDCVLGDHVPLLVLEVISKGELINGNFPLQYNLINPERGETFLKTFTTGKLGAMKATMQKLGFESCYFVLEDRFMSKWSLLAFRHLLGEPRKFGERVFIWKMRKHEI